MAEKNTNNYTSDYDNHKEWCQNCICFGSVPTDKHWLCSESLLEGFPEVAYCGHCDKFSNGNKKMSFQKYWWLKFWGFQFKNKAR